MKRKRFFALCIIASILLNIMVINECYFIENENSITTFAEESNEESEEKYCLGTLKKTDKKYSNGKKISSKDVHYGWELGNFYIKGYTDVVTSDKDNPVFLKTVGDEVKLYFNLTQNINKLNGSKRKKISDDCDAIDEYFGLKKQKFHHGALIVRKINYQNEEEDPIVYTDYLKGIEKGAETEVDIFEEGDYEVALDYQITHQDHKIASFTVDNDYYNYRIFFRFSVRNGNCMVFPFDVSTGAELSNAAFTENGFYLDLANSRYLDINIKKKVLNESGDSLVEDVRFNKPAKDKEEFTEEGIYEITVKNNETGESTEKIIYVGKDSLLKAYATTGFTLPEIKEKLDNGASIDDNGNIVYLDATTTKKESKKMTDDEDPDEFPVVVIYVAIIILVLVIAIIVLKQKGTLDKIKENIKKKKNS